MLLYGLSWFGVLIWIRWFCFSIPGNLWLEKMAKIPESYREDKLSFEGNRDSFNEYLLLSGFSWNDITTQETLIDIPCSKEYHPDDETQWFCKASYRIPMDRVLYDYNDNITGFILRLVGNRTRLNVWLYHFDPLKEYPSWKEMFKRVISNSLQSKTTYYPFMSDDSYYPLENLSLSHGYDRVGQKIYSCLQFINSSKFSQGIPGKVIEDDCRVKIINYYDPSWDSFRNSSSSTRTDLLLQGWYSHESESTSLKIIIQKMK